MKGIVFLLIAGVFGVFSNCYAQYKNNKWILGYEPLLFDFIHDSLENSVYNTQSIYYHNAHSNISDSNGLIFSCNGFKIIDKFGDKMDGSDGILPKKFIQAQGDPSPLIMQSIILPKIDSQYYVFLWSISDALWDSIQNGLSAWRYDILTYSIVEIKENNGKGKVISKLNYLLEHDSLSACQMNAVRHANGRDWWLVKPHNQKHKFYTFLVTSDRITQQPIQEFDSPDMLNGVNGQGNFSVDGSLYVLTAEANPSRTTQINYFDRCTGKMTKYKTIPWIYDSIAAQWMVVSTACFSPNNQFVYLINNLSIIQYDLDNDERVEIIASGTNTNNWTSYNAPDGKIYLGNFNLTSSSISYIEFPDRKGIAANYCKSCYQTKNNNTASPPNNPNYELGALKGSPCDTIKATVNTIIKIYPNPTNDILNIELPTGTKNVSVIIYNMLGEVLLKQNIEQLKDDKLKVSVSHLARSLYSIKIEADDVSFVGKFVKG